MRILQRPLRFLTEASAFLAGVAIAQAQVPVTTSTGGGAGNPFTPPAERLFSIYDYQEIDNVSDRLEEFIELNQSLPGSVKPASLTADTALRNLRALLTGDKNRAFLKSAGDAPRLRTAEGLNAGAVIFFAHGRSAEAFGCLLLAEDKAKNDASALLNLASAALIYRQANEALALIAAAEQKGDLPAGAWGLSGARVVDYLRGYAFMLRGEYLAARPLLVRVVQAEPNLKEAALTLALVESKLGENPRKSFLTGVWRHRGKLIVRDTKEPTSEEETPREPDAFTEGESISPSMASFLDVSQGTSGRLPPLQRPRTPVELMAMLEPYTANLLECMSEAARLQNATAGPALAAFADSKAPPAYERRMTALYNRAVLRIGAVPELDRAARETDFLRKKLDQLTESEIAEAMAAQEPIKRRHAELNNLPGHPTAAELRKQYAELNTTTQRALERTSRLLENYHHALDREFTLRSSYMHGMLAHIGAPALRTALLAEAEAVRYEMQHLRLSSVINLSHAIGAPEEASSIKPDAGEAGRGPSCSDEDAKKSISVDVEICSVEVSCNSVSLEIEELVIPPWVTLSAEVSLETSGTVTIFAGPKLSVTGTGSAKEGVYLTAGKDGVSDFGVKSELKASRGVGPISVSHKIGEGKISFLPGPDTGPPAGPLPAFGVAR